MEEAGGSFAASTCSAQRSAAAGQVLSLPLMISLVLSCEKGHYSSQLYLTRARIEGMPPDHVASSFPFNTPAVRDRSTSIYGCVRLKLWGLTRSLQAACCSSKVFLLVSIQCGREVKKRGKGKGDDGGRLAVLAVWRVVRAREEERTNAVEILLNNISARWVLEMVLATAVGT